MQSGPERGTGNIYDRLEAARRRRERLLQVPFPANDDRVTVPAHSAVPEFPKLKPPADPARPPSPARRWDWAVPWLLGLVIFTVIFAFAVG